MKTDTKIYNLSPIMWGRPNPNDTEWSLKISICIIGAKAFRNVDNNRKSDFLSSLNYHNVKRFQWVVKTSDSSSADESGDLLRPVSGSSRPVSANDV